MKKTLLCLLIIPLFANAKETLGVGEYRYGPDTTQNFACQAAEEKAKEHAITRYVGDQIESVAYETCQNESCDLQKNTFNEIKGEIKTIISKNVKTIENSGYTSCIVSVVADVHRIKNTINISLNDDFFNLREREEVKFKGTSNRIGYLTVFNFYDGEIKSPSMINLDIQDSLYLEKMKESQAVIEYLDTQEFDTSMLSLDFNIAYDSLQRYSHVELHPSMFLSFNGHLLPFTEHNASGRVIFSSKHVKQGISTYAMNFNNRIDTSSVILNNPELPLTQGRLHKAITQNKYGQGQNIYVAIVSYNYNQEDSILLNDNALRRGMFHTTYYHSYDIMEESLDSGFSDGKMVVLNSTKFGNVATDPKYRESVNRPSNQNYDLLDGDGIIRKGVHINDETVLVGIVTPILDGTGHVKEYKDVSYMPKRGQHGIIDDVYRYITPEGLRGVKIRVAEHRIPVLGDKYSARHGQKGTVGMRIPEEDMPFTSKGLRPDMIVNPHAFPSRMTIGQFVETMATFLM